MVERTGLENQQGFLLFVGSNPTPSANKINKNMDNKNQIIIDNYSRINSSIYENRINKNFLYGNETKKFVQKLNIKDENILIADIGCGTGFVF